MSNFIESSIGMQNTIMVIMEICLVFEFILILLRVTQVAGLKKIISAIVLFGVSLLLITMLANDHQYSMGRQEQRSMFPDISGILVLSGIIGLAIYLMGKIQEERKREKTILSSWSVYEAVDNAPCGVCFADSFGQIIICNSKMWEVSQMLTGAQLQDYEVLHQAIHSENVRPGIIPISFDDSVFYFPNGKVWMFQEYYLQSPDLSDYRQAVAIDVSEIYYNSKEIKANNERLKEFNQKLEKMYEKIGDKIREQETLAMKMQVHDNFGRSLFMIRRILENKENTSYMDKQLDVLKEQVYILTNMTVENMEDLYQNTEKQAKELGITIRMKGNVPENSVQRILIDRAIRECVTNCARHAHGSEINVTIEDEIETYIVRITNDGDVPGKNAREGGGLSALRRALEIENCNMITVFEPAFCLLLKLPKVK